uniref:Protein kinase domain-containing protein n=1 Tax=Romanomermis culicivorax TaxID=13658 RepID=A0A915I1K9_ROMCU
MHEPGGFQSFYPSDLDSKELLGKGCFGEVYKVIHKQTGAVMVLKCLYRMDQKGESDFLQEAAFMRNLCHPNVLGILGILYKDKKLHIVSEYIPCGSLRACLDSNVPLSWMQELSIAKDVSAGMAYLHSKRIIHRDLTSCNILLREKYSNAVVADFGLALMLSKRMSRQRRLQAGDPYVMAPEMIREESYDERADIFSFGVTLCEMIGKCNVDPDVLTRNKNFGIDRDSFLTKFILCTDCPKPFYELALKCASVDPQERPPFDLLYDWISALMAACAMQDYSEFDQFVDEIKSFTGNSSMFCDDDNDCHFKARRSANNSNLGDKEINSAIKSNDEFKNGSSSSANSHKYYSKTPPASRPSSSCLARWSSLNRRKISLDLGYYDSTSPQGGYSNQHLNSTVNGKINGLKSGLNINNGAVNKNAINHSLSNEDFVSRDDSVITCNSSAEDFD